MFLLIKNSFQSEHEIPTVTSLMQLSAQQPHTTPRIVDKNDENNNIENFPYNNEDIFKHMNSDTSVNKDIKKVIKSTITYKTGTNWSSSDPKSPDKNDKKDFESHNCFYDMTNKSFSISNKDKINETISQSDEVLTHLLTQFIKNIHQLTVSTKFFSN